MGSKSHSKKHHDNTQDGSTILRIPKVSMPSTTNTAHTVTSSGNQAAMPTTLRVRKDLMFLGLQANPPVADANPNPESQGISRISILTTRTEEQYNDRSSKTTTSTSFETIGRNAQSGQSSGQ